jgi:hypothetical protein
LSSADISSELCVGCGLCCDGVLYEHAKVAPGEEAPMKQAGLHVMAREGKVVFRLPCGHFADGRCTIFDSGRFRICSEFECSLLKRTKAGECTVAAAREQVAAARILLARVTEHDPQAKFAAVRRRSRERLAKKMEAGATPEDAQHLLSLIALDSFLERWFRLPHEKSSGPGRKDDQAAGRS